MVFVSNLDNLMGAKRCFSGRLHFVVIPLDTVPVTALSLLMISGVTSSSPSEYFSHCFEELLPYKLFLSQCGEWRSRRHPHSIGAPLENVIQLCSHDSVLDTDRLERSLGRWPSHGPLHRGMKLCA